MRFWVVLLLVISLLIGIGLSIRYATQRRIICLVPFRGVTPTQTRLVAKAVAALYGLPVAVLPANELPATAICPVRHRYRARAVLNFLGSQITTSTNAQVKLLALTIADIEIEAPPQKSHWGVLGLTNEIGGGQCVVSTFRLAERTDRLVKVSLHEVGHMLHLPHCTSNTPACLMNDAQGKVATVDTERIFLCKHCKSTLRW